MPGLSGFVVLRMGRFCDYLNKLAEITDLDLISLFGLVSIKLILSLQKFSLFNSAKRAILSAVKVPNTPAEISKVVS